MRATQIKASHLQERAPRGRISIKPLLNTLFKTPREFIPTREYFSANFQTAEKFYSKLYSPWGLSVDSDGNIIVVDTGDKFIKIFSPNGKFLTKIGGKGSLTFPIHCIQCGFRYLIVSDRD